jgi:hypothetical protein
MERPGVRLMAGFIFLSLVAPAFVCDSPESPEEATACCRAMKFTCHKPNASEPCCRKQPSARAQVGVAPTWRAAQVPLSAASPLAAFPVAPLPQGRTHCILPLFGGLPPPIGPPPLLLKSVLLI